MTTMYQVLKDCRTIELVRISWFLEDHEDLVCGCSETEKQKEVWMEEIVLMAEKKHEDLIERDLEVDLVHYITRIKNIVQVNPGRTNYRNIKFDLNDTTNVTGVLIEPDIEPGESDMYAYSGGEYFADYIDYFEDNFTGNFGLK